MAQRAREMTLQDIGVEQRVIPLPHRLEEVFVVERVVAAGEFPDFFAVIVVDDASVSARDHQFALTAVEDDADAGSVELFGVQIADLKDEPLAAGVLVNADLSV